MISTGITVGSSSAAAGIKGFCFVISGDIPAAGVRINYPTAQPGTEDKWFYKTMSSKPGAQTILFTDVKQETKSMYKFDPSLLTAIQIEAHANMTAPVKWNYCIESISAIVQ